MGRTPWPGADQRIAAALGVKLTDLFSDYRLPEKPKPAELPPDTRTEEEVAEGLQRLNEGLKSVGQVANEADFCTFTETSPGVYQGQGNYVTWHQQQQRRNKK